MGHRNRRRHSCGKADASLTEIFFSDSNAVDPEVDRKCKQVCREVFRVLAQAEPADPRLSEIMILEVAPAPDASRLAVRVQLQPGADVTETMAALGRWKPSLRAEIAQALQRKRTPELVFEPAVASSDDPEDAP